MATDPNEARAGTRPSASSGEYAIEPEDYHGQPARRRATAIASTLRETDASRGLGFLSIGLGLGALLVPGSLGRLIGMSEHEGLLRMVGARELASGAALLSQPDPRPGLWSRVAGDAMDLALLGAALRRSNPDRGRAMGALAVVAAIAAIDVAASVRETSLRRAAPVLKAKPLMVEQSVNVAKPPAECYAFWRNVTNVPRFIPLLESVTAVDERRSHWVMKGPGGKRVEWDSEITVDSPGERLAWHSLPDSDVMHAGIVHFDASTGGRGTLVRVMLHYHAPAGRVGGSLAKVLGTDPNSTVREDLRRFKSLIEAGEIATTRGQPSGRRSFLGRLTPEGRKSREGASS